MCVICLPLLDTAYFRFFLEMNREKRETSSANSTTECTTVSNAWTGRFQSRLLQIFKSFRFYCRLQSKEKTRSWNNGSHVYFCFVVSIRYKTLHIHSQQFFDSRVIASGIRGQGNFCRCHLGWSTPQPWAFSRCQVNKSPLVLESPRNHRGRTCCRRETTPPNHNGPVWS